MKQTNNIMDIKKEYKPCSILGPVRTFSLSIVRYSDLDKLFEKANQQRKEMEEFKRKLENEKVQQKEIEKLRNQETTEAPKDIVSEERNFLFFATDRSGILREKQLEVRNTIWNRIQDLHSKIHEKNSDVIFNKYDERRNAIIENSEKKTENLEAEFKGENSIAYLHKRIDIEANHFKKLSQLLEKEEEELDKEMKKVRGFDKNKDQYEKDRLE